MPVALISLVDDERQFFKSSLGMPEPWCAMRETPLSHSLCKQVVATEGPLVIDDVPAHPLAADSPGLPALGVAAYAGIPIRLDGQVLGSLCAIDHSPRSWSAEDLTLLTGLAGLVEEMIVLRIGALGRDRLQAELLDAARRSRARADERHRAETDAMRAVAAMNRRLQRALLPRPAEVHFSAFAVASAYVPGARDMVLGGDFADVREADGGGIGFVIGDVTGHGPEAAALGASLRAAWHTLSDAGTPGDRVMQGLNTALMRERQDEGLMATVIVGSVDAAGATLTLSIAGHPPPVLVSHAPEFIDTRIARGLILGWTADARWPSAAIPLEGRSVLLYTDGLTEVRTPKGRRDGEALLLETIGAWCRVTDGSLLPNVAVRAAERAHGGPLADDVAVIHIRPRP